MSLAFTQKCMWQTLLLLSKNINFICISIVNIVYRLIEKLWFYDIIVYYIHLTDDKETAVKAYIHKTSDSMERNIVLVSK